MGQAHGACFNTSTSVAARSAEKLVAQLGHHEDRSSGQGREDDRHVTARSTALGDGQDRGNGARDARPP